MATSEVTRATWQSSCVPFTGWGARDVSRWAGHSALPTGSLQLPGPAGHDFGKGKGCGPPSPQTPASTDPGTNPGRLSASCALRGFRN